MKKFNFSLYGFFLLALIFLTFYINPIYAADEIIRSMDDLNTVTDTDGIFRYNSIGKNDDILILYKNESDNNIGNLGLKKKDFVSGETIDPKLDVLRTSGFTSTENLIDEISKNENVTAVDLNDRVYSTEIVNDPYFEKNQKGIFAQVKADKTLNLNQNNLTKVAVLDTGIDPQHEDLKNRYLLEGYNYVSDTTDCTDDNDHGTGVAGIIAASTNNNYGIAGFTGTSNIKIVPFKVLDDEGSGYVKGIVAAINAVNNSDIRIINFSLGLERDNKVLKSAIVEGYRKNKILVAASGNNGASNLMYPAAYDEVISVGAVNNSNKRCTSFDWGKTNGSAYGIGLDFMAPGCDIPMTEASSHSFCFNSGTSFACPIVTSLVTLMIQQKPDLTFNELYNYLKNSSLDLGIKGYDVEYGNGLINFEEAINQIKHQSSQTPIVPVQPEQEEKLSINPNSLSMATNQVNLLTPVTNSTKAIVWSSSNSRVATINNGVVHALNPGQTTITANLVGTDIQCTIPVNVMSIDILAISAHSQDIGWLPAVSSMEIAGSTGRNKELEALRIGIADPSLNIQTQVHVSNIGDMSPVNENELAGTTGQAKGIEAIKFKLDGPNAINYDIYYRTHVENYGWTNWTSNENWSGTKGHNLQVEAVQIYITNKNGTPPNLTGDVNWSFM